MLTHGQIYENTSSVYTHSVDVLPGAEIGEIETSVMLSERAKYFEQALTEFNSVGELHGLVKKVRDASKPIRFKDGNVISIEDAKSSRNKYTNNAKVAFARGSGYVPAGLPSKEALQVLEDNESFQFLWASFRGHYGPHKMSADDRREVVIDLNRNMTRINEFAATAK